MATFAARPRTLADIPVSPRRSRSVVVVGMIYGRADRLRLDPTQGKVARYARGGDYHEVLWRRLETLLEWLPGRAPGVVGRAVCDTAPLLERDFARLAGLGWIGKNTCLIDRKAGSFTVLGSLLVDVELAYDAPTRVEPLRDVYPVPGRLSDRRLRRPLSARRPTDASATGRSSTRGRSPTKRPRALGDWAFGCDVCQDVCPWNRKAPAGREPELDARPGWSQPDLIGVAGMRPARLREVAQRDGAVPVEAVGIAPERGPDPGKSAGP